MRQCHSESEESETENETKPQQIDKDQLLKDMRDEHNLKFKTNVLMGIRANEGIMKLTSFVGEDQQKSYEEFLSGLSDKKRNKLLKKIMSTGFEPDDKSTVKKQKHKSKKRQEKVERTSKSSLIDNFKQYYIPQIL